MAAQRQTHPSAEVLKAFALGKLNEGSSGAVLNHLDSCPDCYEQVAAQSGDDFVNRLRQAHGRSSTPAPAKPLGDAARAANPSVSRAPVSNLPPELAANQQYEILRELGRGGMGVVYLAKNKLMDRLEVLKVVNKTLLDHPSAVERFLREIRSAAKLSHANVVGAHSAVQMGELLAFAMEYVEGQDLASLVKSQGPLPIAHACFYVQQAAAGLQHAHEKGMVHRDIKPQNLILAREGKKHIVKVLDFGLAKVMREKKDDTGLTGEGKMLGTPDYIAPEQTLDAAKADIRADIYSLGCTLYYLLSGHPPFSASSLGAILVAHQMHEAKPLNLERPEVPEELAAVVRKMMAKTPAKRYQTPLQVAQALVAFIKSGSKQEAKGSSALPLGTESPGKGTVFEVETSEEKKMTQEAPTKAPPKEVTAVEEASPFAELEANASVELPRAPKQKGRKGCVLTVAVSISLALTLIIWAGGVFEGKVQVKTKDGILIVEVNEPNPEILVDGEKVTVTWHHGGKKAEIHVNPGTHKVEIQKDGFSVDGKELTFKDGDRNVFTALLRPTPAVLGLERATNGQVAGATDDGEGFVPLFNGKDKTGWIMHPSQPDNWRVEKGVLVGSGRGTSYLFTKSGDFKDFRLRIEARINDGGQGGVYFRTPYGLEFPGFGSLHPLGYAVKINDTSPVMRENARYTGTLVILANANPIMGHWEPDGGFRKSEVPFGKWFRMEVIAKGNHIVVKVDGKKINELTKSIKEYTGSERLFTSGHIALQQFDGASVVEFRKLEIKELPATKAEAPGAAGAAVPPSLPRHAERSLPPVAKEAAKAFEKARDDARAKLLAEFDTVLDRLAKTKGPMEMINVVKEEKERFESRGLIPWSKPMWSYLTKYIASNRAAEEKIHRVYSSLIDAQLRVKNESMVADLKADLKNLLDVRVVARWDYFLNGRPKWRNFCLSSDGRIYGSEGTASCSFENGVLTIRYPPDPKAPGGAWIDRLQVSDDGTSFSGTNNAPSGRGPLITGVYLKGDVMD